MYSSGGMGITPVARALWCRTGQSSTMLQRVFLLSLLLCTGSQQISNPQAFSPTGKSLILAVPELSLCLSGSAASMSPVASAAARSALRRAVTMSVWGRRRSLQSQERPSAPGSGGYFPAWVRG